jgi:hypothetical protein
MSAAPCWQKLCAGRRHKATLQSSRDVLAAKTPHRRSNLKPGNFSFSLNANSQFCLGQAYLQARQDGLTRKNSKGRVPFLSFGRGQ